MKKDKNISRKFDAINFIGSKGSTIIINNKKYEIFLKDKPECSNACPAGVNVKAYISLIANKKFEEAVDVIREANPFPAICGRVCNRPCEDNCEQGLDGDTVQIRALKRFACDYELARRPLKIEPCETIYAEKIAVVGAGPAGLSASVDLIRLGYPVTVFEAEDEPGGMLRYAIPAYRLPKRILKREIDWIKNLGVEILTGKRIKNPEKLLKEGFSAVLIAQGSPESLTLGIDGESSNGVLDPLTFLYKVNTNQNLDIHGNVVVIGGGSTAFDVARSAVRLGAKKVTIAYRRSLEEIPAEPEEIEDAINEGVELKTLLIPNKIIEENKQVKAIEFLKARLGEPDESGRKKPIPIKNSECQIKADFIFPAVGAKPNIENLKQLEITDKKDTIKVEEYNKTGFKGIFAAGDVESGPSYVVEAIKQGHIAAEGIDIYLRGGKESKFKHFSKKIPIVEETKDKTKSSYKPKRIGREDRIKSFSEVEKSFLDFEAVEEAGRCFKCGPCTLCTICLPNCDNKQLLADIEDSKILLKVPKKVSSFVYENDNSIFDIKNYNDISKPVKLRTLIAYVDSTLCIGCGRCEEVCAYRAIRNVFRKDKPITAEVDHDSCVSCSACVSACPTGAISQGYMSDNEILERMSRKKPINAGVKALISYWNSPVNSFDEYNGIVELMSGRKISPSFLIRAFARAGRGLLVIGPDDEKDAHYLQWEEHPKGIVEKARNILKFVGISPNRIQYNGVENNAEPTFLYNEFVKNLDDDKISDLKILLPKIIMNPLSEALLILRILSANPDIEAVDDIIKISTAKENGIALFEGCLPLLNIIGSTSKLFDLSNHRVSLHKLLEKLGFDYGFIPGLLCPSKSISDLDIENSDEIVNKIAENNFNSYNSLKPSKFILATPESYITFSRLNDFKNTVSLPEELYKKLKNYKDFRTINKVIAIHRANHLENDSFYDFYKKILSLIPGVSTVDLDENCVHNGFDSLNSDSKLKDQKIFNEASEKGADAIICTSPYCASHLLLCNREGSWLTNDIEITDIFSIILDSLGGDDF